MGCAKVDLGPFFGFYPSAKSRRGIVMISVSVSVDISHFSHTGRNSGRILIKLGMMNDLGSVM